MRTLLCHSVSWIAETWAFTKSCMISHMSNDLLVIELECLCRDRRLMASACV